MLDDPDLKKQLLNNAAELKDAGDRRRAIKCASGRTKKELHVDWLVAQLFRTCERLAPVSSLRPHRDLLRRALVCLKVR